MRYAISTTWRHDNPIDDGALQAMMADSKAAAESDGIVEVVWFKLDAHTHGSILLYSSEEAYEKHQERLKEFRKTRTGITLLREEKGPSIAVLSEV